jgi:catechol 2,3-dioxygenase-like lactoylglutathione lyase family enzyme
MHGSGSAADAADCSVARANCGHLPARDRFPRRSCICGLTSEKPGTALHPGGLSGADGADSRASRRRAELSRVGSRPPRSSTRVDVLASRILLHPGDLERSLRFYGETLGLAVFREWGSGSDRGVVFFLGAGLLEVSGSSSEPPSGAVRLLLQVRDVQQAWRRLAAAGVVIEEEPKRKPWGLIEMVARDPDGLAIVIVEVPPGHPQRRAA